MDNYISQNKWVSAYLLDISTLVRGVTYKKVESRQEKADGLLPILRATNINNGRLSFDNLVYVPEEKISSHQKLKVHDIVVATSSGSKNLVGKAASVTNNWNGSCGAFCTVIRPVSILESSYLFFYTQSNSYKKQILDLSSGVNINNIRISSFKNIEIPIPPLEEQKIIVEYLSQLLGRVNNLKHCIDAISDIIKQFRESVLSDAISGELTKDLRDDFNILDWKNVLLKDVALKFSYGTSSKSSKEGKVPVLRMGNIQNGKLEWDNLVFTSNQAEIEKYKLKKGDILFNRTNSPKLVGKTAIYLGEQEAIYAGYLIKVECGDNLLPKFLNIHLNSPRAGRYCKRVKSDGVSQSNINAKKLASYSLSLPTMEEQIEIIKRVESLFSFADNIEKQVEAIQARVKNITPFILKKAFQGELTAEWRTKNYSLITGENSAKNLLEKIKLKHKEQIKENKHKRSKQKRKTSTRKKKVTISIIEALKEVNQAISANELLIQSGYPKNADIGQIERFFLDIRQQLEGKKITCERIDDEDYFKLIEQVNKP